VAGPLEYLAIRFPGNHFRGEIGPALREATEKGIIRVIDIAFAYRDERGELSVFELDDLDAEDAGVFDPIVQDVTGLLSDTDIREVCEVVEPDSSVALMLFEHVWAENLRDALIRADGQFVAGGLIPREAVDEVQAAAPAAR
jgi:Family of unknown function (DUF6325)